MVILRWYMNPNPHPSIFECILKTVTEQTFIYAIIFVGLIIFIRSWMK